MPISSIDNLTLGKSIKGFFLCEKKYTKTTRLGDIYLDLFLKDSTGSIRAKLWSNIDHFSLKFEQGDIVAIKGSIISFNGKNEINIKFINAVSDSFYDEYGFSNSLIIEKIKESKNNLYKYINLKIKSLPKSDTLLIEEIYNNNLEKVKSIPIPINGFEKDGGYLLYTYRLLYLYDKLNKEFENLNYNRIVVCILLMNVGYFDYYSLTPTFTITEKAKYINHKKLGLNILITTLQKFKKINQEDEIFYYQCLSENKCDINEPNINFVDALNSLESIYNNC